MFKIKFIMLGGLAVANAAFLLYIQTSYYEKSHFTCTGSAVKEDFAITAAHCSYDPNNGSFVQPNMMNITYFIKEEVVYDQVKELFLHPRYKKLSSLFDLMLLKPVKKFEHILPVLVRNPNEKDECELFGFEIVNKKPTPRRIPVAILIGEKCMDSIGFLICIEFKTKGFPCSDDGGGPLMCDSKLVGVLHIGHDWVSECYERKSTKIHYNSLAAHRKWLYLVSRVLIDDDWEPNESERMMNKPLWFQFGLIHMLLFILQ